jgi:hypothetical protein
MREARRERVRQKVHRVRRPGQGQDADGDEAVTATVDGGPVD